MLEKTISNAQTRFPAISLLFHTCYFFRILFFISAMTFEGCAAGAQLIASWNFEQRRLPSSERDSSLRVADFPTRLFRPSALCLFRGNHPRRTFSRNGKKPDHIPAAHFCYDISIVTEYKSHKPATKHTTVPRQTAIPSFKAPPFQWCQNCILISSTIL